MDSEPQAKAKLPTGFDWPDRRAATTAGRWYFLSAVARFTPALSELAKRPLAAYAIAEKNIDAEDADVWAIPVTTSQRHYTVNVPPVDGIDWDRVAAEDPSAPPALINLRDELSTWADRFHLNAPWCMERAVATMAMWHSSPGWPRHHWQYGAVAGFGPLREDETKITFETAGLPLAVALRIVTDHYAQMDRLIRERGYVVAESKRNAAHFYLGGPLPMRRRGVRGHRADGRRNLYRCRPGSPQGACMHRSHGPPPRLERGTPDDE